MSSIYETILLTPAESAVYDSRDDQAGADLRHDIDARAIDILRAGDTISVSVCHPDGFVAWHYGVGDLRANGGTL